MEFVSQLVFGGAEQPTDEVIKWLMDCVTFNQGTRVFSIFNVEDVVDPTPVLRSFLLKHLLKLDNRNSAAVNDYLDRFVGTATQGGQFTEAKFSFVLLLIDILKVSLHLTSCLLMLSIRSFWSASLKYWTLSDSYTFTTISCHTFLYFGEIGSIYLFVCPC